MDPPGTQFNICIGSVVTTVKVSSARKTSTSFTRRLLLVRHCRSFRGCSAPLLLVAYGVCT